MIEIIFLIIVILGFLLIFVSEKMFERTNYYKKNFTETEKFKAEGPVDYVNTGSTFAFYGINYDCAGVKGLNLALCPQSLEADFKMLKHFEKRYNDGAIVFIVISDLAFAKKGYSAAKTNDRYYKVLKANEIEGYSLLKALRAKYLPVLYNWKNFLRFHWDIRSDHDYELAVNENDREAVKADAFIRCQSWMKEFSLDNLTDARQSEKYKEVFEFTTNIVKDMIFWCKKRGYRPVLVNLPITSEMREFFSDEFLKAFYYDQINVSENVPIIDLQSEAQLSDYLLYLDSCRLNSVGREVVTKFLLREAEKTM